MPKKTEKNLLVGLDIGTGKSLNAVQFNRPITLHPDTGLALENIQIAASTIAVERFINPRT